MKINSRNYYGVSYCNGVAVCARTGKRYLAHFHSFPTSKERNEWCSHGGEFRSSTDWRESVKSSDAELRYCQAEQFNVDPYRDTIISHP
jgi:hypothetical protein